MSFFSYRQGLKDGRQIDKGEVLKPIIAKKKADSEFKKDNDIIAEGIKEMASWLNRKR